MPTPNLHWQRADGTDTAHRLTQSRNQQLPGSWHPSGKVLAFEEVNPETQSGLMILPMDGGGASNWRPGVARAFANTHLELHPNGRRVAIHPADPPVGASGDHVTLILNFSDEIRRLGPGAKP